MQSLERGQPQSVAFYLKIKENTILKAFPTAGNNCSGPIQCVMTTTHLSIRQHAENLL